MSTTHWDHGVLPEIVAAVLRCPAVVRREEIGEAGRGAIGHPNWPGYTIEVVAGSGYRIKFRCSACRFEFTASEAQLRRLVA